MERKRITYQDRILKEIFLRVRDVSVSKLIDTTGLKRKQVLRALQRLTERGLIIKKKEFSLAGYKTPPICDLKINLKNFNFIRDYLIKRGLL